MHPPYRESSNFFKLKNLFPGCAGSKGSARCANGFFMVIDGHVSLKNKIIGRVKGRVNLIKTYFVRACNSHDLVKT